MKKYRYIIKRFGRYINEVHGEHELYDWIIENVPPMGNIRDTRTPVTIYRGIDKYRARTIAEAKHYKFERWD